MFGVRACPPPAQCLLGRYAGGEHYVDAYTTELPHAVRFEDFVTAFYTSTAFRPERLVLGVVLARPSTDAEVRALAAGETDAFAAWFVEARSADELLLSDLGHRTRSWLHAASAADGAGTSLYFGSAVVGTGDAGRRSLPFRALLRFHRQYSVTLLAAAARRLR